MSTHICENCGKEHDGSYGSGRFCSDHCRRVWVGKHSAHNGNHKCNFPRRLPAPYGTWVCDKCGIVCDTRHKLSAHRKQYHADCIAGPNNTGGIAWNKGLTQETDVRIKNIATKLKNMPHKKWTADQKKAMSENRTAYYKNHPEKHPARLLAGNRNKMSYPERIAYEWLTAHNISFVHHFHYAANGINRYVDFFIEKYQLFIEIDGEFQHKNRKPLDSLKDKIASNQGIQTLRILAKANIELKLAAFFSEFGDLAEQSKAAPC